MVHLLSIYSMQNFTLHHQSGNISHSSEELAEGRGACNASAKFTQLAAFSSQVFQVQALEPESLRSVMPEVSLPKGFTGPTSSANVAHLVRQKRETGQVDLLRLDALPHGSSCQMLRSLLQKVWDSWHLYQQQIQSACNSMKLPGASSTSCNVRFQSGRCFFRIFGQAFAYSEILDSLWWQRLWMLFLDEKCLLVIQIPPPFEFTPHGCLVAHSDSVVLAEQDMLALWHWYRL